MNNNIDFYHNSDSQEYTPPVCQELIEGAQGDICASETEIVGEMDGEW